MLSFYSYLFLAMNQWVTGAETPPLKQVVTLIY